MAHAQLNMVPQKSRISCLFSFLSLLIQEKGEFYHSLGLCAVWTLVLRLVCVAYEADLFRLVHGVLWVFLANGSKVNEC